MKFNLFLFVSLCAAMNSQSYKDSKVGKTPLCVGKSKVDWFLKGYLWDFTHSLPYENAPEMEKEAVELLNEFIICTPVISGILNDSKLEDLKEKLDEGEKFNNIHFTTLIEYKLEKVKAITNRMFNPNVFITVPGAKTLDEFFKSLMPPELPKSIRGMMQAVEDFYYNLYQVIDKEKMSEEAQVFFEAYYAPFPSIESIELTITEEKEKPFVTPLWFWAFTAVIGLFGVVVAICWGSTWRNHTKK